MNHFYKTLLLAVPVLISACGGGSGGTPASVALTAGDYFVYQSTSTVPGVGQTDSYYTNTLAHVGADGSATEVQTSGEAGPYSQTTINADYQETDWLGALASLGPDTTNCKNVPQIDGPGRQLAVGKAWNLTYTRTCGSTSGSGSPSSTVIVNTGSVTAVESVTSPAGTFNAFKLAYTITSKSSDISSVAQYTCWRDRVTNQTIACQTTTSSNGTSSTTYTRLIGYSVAASSAQVLTPARFAGLWRIKWGGSNSGSCPVVIVSANGNFSDSCTYVDQLGNQAVTPISGSVAADGRATASLGTGAQWSGTFSSPLVASGTWANTGASGAWQAAHVAIGAP